MTLNEMANKLNRTKLSIHGKYRKLGLELPEDIKSQRNIENGKTSVKTSGENHCRWKGGIAKKAYEYQNSYRKKYRENIRARDAVSKAIKSGKLTKQPCERCGNKKSQAHHEDYSKPLEVIWLCRQCHIEREKEMREEGLK